MKRLFPINYIRNVALNNTKTPYSIFIDVDLIPGRWLYKDLKNYIMNNSHEKQVAYQSNYIQNLGLSKLK